jgi:glyoxylase-like metal-dependent hydrolase (beta-lactamase superfamily II)
MTRCMSEPKTRAKAIEPVIPTVYRWHLADDRLGGSESDAYAVAGEKGVVLVDPLPIDEAQLEALGNVQAIVLTAACHQRSAWRYRRRFGAPVWAPEGPGVSSTPGDVEEEPDGRFRDGARLPGGLRAVHAPGPTDAMYALALDRGGGVLFLTDTLIHDGSGTPGFVPAEYQDDPRRTRDTVRRLAASDGCEVLCFAHGPPVVGGGRAALERALRDDREKLA